ncbi:MAG: transposase [Thermoanaerobaculia bacterium]|nr:transposase [Thermoanaerobaculia bacterium]
MARRDAICSLYERMGSLPPDEIVLCFDPKPGIQILGNPRYAHGRWDGPRGGRHRLIEFEYRRLGTRTLVAFVAPATGDCVYHDVYHKDRRYDSEATVELLENARRYLLAAGFNRVHLVLDNGSTHTSRITSKYFKEHEDFWVTYFTPVHASWLNLCENFFSTFSRRYLRHRRYAHVEEFREKLPLWLDDHNGRCKPLRWTYAPHQRDAA